MNTKKEQKIEAAEMMHFNRVRDVHDPDILMDSMLKFIDDICKIEKEEMLSCFRCKTGLTDDVEIVVEE